MAGSAVVAVLTNDVGQTGALPGVLITTTLFPGRALVMGSAQVIAHTLSAATLQGVAVVAEPAALTLRPLGVVQAPHAPACLPVTRLGVADVNVAVTLAGYTPTAW